MKVLIRLPYKETASNILTQSVNKSSVKPPLTRFWALGACLILQSCRPALMVARCLSLASSLSNAEVTDSGIDPHHLGFNGNVNEERAQLKTT